MIAKDGKGLITALSTEVEVKIAPFEWAKIGLVVFGCALPANLVKVG